MEDRRLRSNEALHLAQVACRSFTDHISPARPTTADVARVFAAAYVATMLARSDEVVS